MQGRELHLHSMVVHAVLGLTALAAAAFVLSTSAATVGPIRSATWPFLLAFALVGLLVTVLPATLTGITERNHMYANWHASHRAKLVLSLVLLALVVAELAGLHGAALRPGSWLAAAVVVANPIVAFALSFYGLHITLGRQAVARTSYVADARKKPPVDVLAVVAEHVAERARVIEVMEPMEGPAA
jgi:hypothetical protein